MGNAVPKNAIFELFCNYTIRCQCAIISEELRIRRKKNGTIL